VKRGKHRCPDDSIQSWRVAATSGDRQPHQRLLFRRSKQFDDLTWIRMTPQRAFGENQHTVPGHFENAATSLQ
jgi:hypothetical protein